MHPHPEANGARGKGGELADRYTSVRRFTEDLAAPLQPEDCVVQSMPDVSPTKWHLAHVSWFFERFVLSKHLPGYQPYNEAYDHLFNSYYHTAGTMHARPRRGLLSRPLLADIIDYRHAVDDGIGRLLATNDSEEIAFLVELGLHHEQQHQELLLTDIKHVLAQNPMDSPYCANLPTPPTGDLTPLSFIKYEGGLQRIGANAGEPFCFDNETPRHRVLLESFELGSRLITNGESREFMLEGGYDDCALWLSDGWAKVLGGELARPFYWSDDLESEFTLAGRRDIDPNAPINHLSYYEADAFARWAGARLPTEAEWELAAAAEPVDGNFVEAGYLEPCAAPAGKSISQLYGDVWEWTSSAYSPYPGFKPLAGSLGEYNGKFMVSQHVVRGGASVSSAGHLRATYRSFFYPDARWQYLGFRLARAV
ncbi:MAG: ergothioneine biosynthesis protein EgtB [Pseudomonadota bacterium]